MNRIKIRRLIFTILMSIGLFICLFVYSNTYAINGQMNKRQIGANEMRVQKLIAAEDKQKGAHVFRIQDTTNFQPIIENNVEWVTMVSWGYQDDFDSPMMTHHNGDSAYILEHNANWVKQIEAVRAAGFKVFFKPHLWVTHPSDGKWRSDIFPTNDENWELWKNSYTNFILRYAQVAEQANAEMFCIGMEFSKLTVAKPTYWKNLIQEIRNVYSGRITYAANWYKEFEEVSFWHDLDYIGIQAYFPLTKNENPSVEEISKGWKKFLPAIETVHKKYSRKILFTEIGYKSTSGGAIEPWVWSEDPSNQDKTYSAETQANCYKAFFNTVWEKDWFAGAHLWQWRAGYVQKEGRLNLNFTPQGKIAEEVITKGYE